YLLPLPLIYMAQVALTQNMAQVALTQNMAQVALTHRNTNPHSDGLVFTYAPQGKGGQGMYGRMCRQHFVSADFTPENLVLLTITDVQATAERIGSGLRAFCPTGAANPI
ncbi:MAG: hypothetical protein SPI18_05515, partial [Prevotella sp.]|nr:hypothetical protein [Prevotella sp.]